MNGRAKVTLDLFFEIEEEEFNREAGDPVGSEITPTDIKNGLIEQIEEAVRESGNGSSVHLSMGEENTEVKVFLMKWLD